MTQVFEDIVIDAEFASLLPELAADEREKLEQLIVDHGGARDPLVVWPSKGKMTLVDGHNRYEICTRLGLPFDVVEKKFASRAEARVWMRETQGGKRNLTTAWKIELQLANKADLVEIGKAKMSAAGKEGGKTAGRGRNRGLSLGDKPLSEPINTQKQIANAAKTSVGQVAMAEQVREKRPDLWEQAKAGDIGISTAYRQVRRADKEAAREARREENRKKIAAVPEPDQAAAVADAKFATIVIDPPWDWGDEGDQDQLGRARPDYGTMTIDELEQLDVGGLADEDCHIYLWITNRSLPKGFRLLEAWGFRYITAITWVKPHFGMGNYFRGQTEHVLFGVKGSQPLKRKDVGTVFTADRGVGGHSSKPAQFLDLVESCSPGPFLEMFSRSSRPGWVAWGENTNAAE